MFVLLKYDLNKKNCDILATQPTEKNIIDEANKYFKTLDACEIPKLSKVNDEGTYYIKKDDDKYEVYESINLGYIFDSFHTTLKSYIFVCSDKPKEQTPLAKPPVSSKPINILARK